MSRRSDDSSASTEAREVLAQRIWSVFPALKRQLQAALPVDLSDQLTRVTPHQLEALHFLQRLDQGSPAGGASMNELARAQHCALSTATALADRLIKQGLAERINDPEDRRVVRIAPTGRGREFTRRFAEARHDVALRALAALDDREIAILVKLLDKIAAAPEAETQAEEVAG